MLLGKQPLLPALFFLASAAAWTLPARTAVPSARRTELFATRGTVPAMSEALETQIKEAVAGSKVVIYSKSYCPFCNQVKALFNDLGQLDDAVVVELDQVPDGAELQGVLATMTGQRTVPNVFVAGQHVGGNDATQAANRDGKLAELLK
eukprot:CAMPEP_0206179244 /NCGR_PEP_ID=MMETSP1474-20131121/66885_1 /ASSEMBLY_ACC=CAM_ASM_001110 /TAXON_ID=97495 /ORGANISM="Imantonia sp., Strain RCC918" /LENGTH=148 /DNA_ID=CAMNT_0053592387 /DNA_START=44 /DNA_END=490 /DNA_ORIENTATION=-